MSKPRPHPASSPDAFLLDMYHAKTAAAGGIVRRKVRDVERYVGRDVFIADLRRRGFRAIENSGHFIVFCNREPFKVIE